MKKILLTFWISLLFLGSCQSEASPSGSDEKKDYGVFIGLNPANIETLYNYRMVIIDAALFTPEQIKTLRDKDIKVYSYLNIGAIENDRDYDTDGTTNRRNEFWGKTLKDYDGWDNERWMDMSYTPWQDFLAHTMGKRLAEKGIDGFFLDNLDVYDEIDQIDPAKGETSYNGLVATLVKLNSANTLPMIINGGDKFVKRALANNKLNPQVKGVNQECVFTTITSYNGTGAFSTKTEGDRQYFLDALKLYKESGLQVYLIEYKKDRSGPEADKIADYCRENEFRYFIATSLLLDKE